MRVGKKTRSSVRIQKTSRHRGVPVKKLHVRLGWKTKDDTELDLDVSCFLLTKDRKCRNIFDCVYYGSSLAVPTTKVDGSYYYIDVPKQCKARRIQTGEIVYEFTEPTPKYEYHSLNQEVIHCGDVRTGGGEEEVIKVDLSNILTAAADDDIHEILFVVTTYGENQSLADAQSISVIIEDHDGEQPRNIGELPVKFIDHSDQNSPTSCVLGHLVKEVDSEFWNYTELLDLENKSLQDYMKEFGIDAYIELE